MDSTIGGPDGPTTPGGPIKRIPQLDGLRGIAVLLVFFYHALRLHLGWVGVDVFFVLSGFLITGILLRLKESRATTGYWKPFYARRALRLLPPYLGFLAVCVLVLNLPWMHLWYWYVLPIGNFAPLYADVSIPFSLSHLWSLAAEEQFYFIWPVMVLLLSPRQLRGAAWALVLAAPLFRFIGTPWFSTNDGIYRLLPFRMDLLACGALVALYATPEWIESRHRSSRFAMIAAGGTLLALSALPYYRMSANSLSFNVTAYSLIVVATGSALIYALGLCRGPIHAILTSKPLRHMGRISYSFYLYQMPVLALLWNHVPSRPLAAVLGFGITLGLTTLSWHYFESPLLAGRPTVGEEGLAPTKV